MVIVILERERTQGPQVSNIQSYGTGPFVAEAYAPDLEGLNPIDLFSYFSNLCFYCIWQNALLRQLLQKRGHQLSPERFLSMSMSRGARRFLP